MKIAEYQKNSNSKVIATLQEYKNSKVLDLRVFYHDLISDEYKPTRKGLTLSIDQIDQLLELIKQAKSEIKNIDQENK